MVSLLMGFTFIFGGGNAIVKKVLPLVTVSSAAEASDVEVTMLPGYAAAGRENMDGGITDKKVKLRYEDLGDRLKWTIVFNGQPSQSAQQRGYNDWPNSFVMFSKNIKFIKDTGIVRGTPVDMNFSLSGNGTTTRGDVNVLDQSTKLNTYEGYLKDPRYFKNGQNSGPGRFLNEFVTGGGLDTYFSNNPAARTYKETAVKNTYSYFAIEHDMRDGNKAISSPLTFTFYTEKSTTDDKPAYIYGVYGSTANDRYSAMNGAKIDPTTVKVPGEIRVAGEHANKPILLEKKSSTDLEVIIPNKTILESGDTLEVHSMVDSTEPTLFTISDLTSSSPRISYVNENGNLSAGVFKIKEAKTIGRNIRITIGVDSKVSNLERYGINESFIERSNQNESINNKAMYGVIRATHNVGQYETQRERGLYINDDVYTENPEYTSDEYRGTDPVYRVLAQSLYEYSKTTENVNDRVIVNSIDNPSSTEIELAKNKLKEFLNKKINNSVKEIEDTGNGVFTAVFTDGSKITNINPLSTKDKAYTNQKVNISGKQRDFMVQKVEPEKVLKKGDDKLTAEEQNKIKAEVVKANPSLQQENVAVDENGKVTTKYADKVTEGPVFEASETVVRVKNPAVQVVENEKELSLREKEKIKDAIISANTDLGIDRLTIKSQ